MQGQAAATLAVIQSMQGTLQVASALIEGGRQVELAGLDEEAARLCLAVGLLPRDSGTALRPALEALLRDLDRVAASLQRSGPPPD